MSITALKLPVLFPSSSLTSKETSPAQPLQPASNASPVSLTPPKPAADTSTDPGKTELRGALNSAVANMEKKLGDLQERGVNVARKTFAKKALGVLFAAAAVGGAVALAVATGGAALVAAAAIAGIVFAVSVGDASCSYMNYRNAQAKAADKEPPYKLPMGGGSGLANLLYWGAKAASASDETARRAASTGDLLLRGGLVVASGVCTMGLSNLADANSISAAVALTTSAATMLQSLVDINKVSAKGLGDTEVEVLKTQLADAKDLLRQIDEAAKLSDQQRDQAFAQLQKKVTESQALIEQLQAGQAQTPAPAAPAPALARSSIPPWLLPPGVRRADVAYLVGGFGWR